MTEILTESFCERCGTRYTFESARPKTRLKGVKVLSRGLKNFVLSDDTSIDEAMAAARSETDREATAHQLDAFHKTFNFCMSCRQYTCPNCWNEPEARCLSCAPLELPAEPVRLEDFATFGQTTLIGAETLVGDAAARNGDAEHIHEASPSPAASPEPLAAAEALAAPESGQVDEAAGETATKPAEPAAAADLDAAQKAQSQTTGLLRRFRPGQSLDAELEAFERERRHEPADVAEEAPSEPAAAELAEAAESEAEGEPAVEPAAAAATPPSSAPEPTPPADVVEQPTWRITAPDSSGSQPIAPTPGPAGQIPVQAGGGAPSAPGEPQWPSRPAWPSATPAAGLPFLGRPATGEGGIDALWAASNQELVATPPAPGRAASTGIQPCVSCGLSLSATARFCRRCGTLQAR